MNTKLYNQLNRACLKAQKLGLQIRPDKFGIKARSGIWKATGKRVCPFGAYLIGKRSRDSSPASHLNDASFYLSITGEQATSIMDGFDNCCFWHSDDYHAIGLKLRAKFHPVK